MREYDSSTVLGDSITLGGDTTIERTAPGVVAIDGKLSLPNANLTVEVIEARDASGNLLIEFAGKHSGVVQGKFSVFRPGGDSNFFVPGYFAASGHFNFQAGTVTSGNIYLWVGGTYLRFDGTQLVPDADSVRNLGHPALRFANVFLTTGIQFGAAETKLRSGTGSPEGVVTAPVGSLYCRDDGGAGTSLYVKESGTGNTGWVGK